MEKTMIGDVTITDANTKQTQKTGALLDVVQIGEDVVGKMISLYYNDSDQKFYKTLATDITKYKARAFSWDAGGLADDFIVVCYGGTIEVRAILTEKRRYMVSPTSGLWMLDTGLASTHFPFQVGTAKSGTELEIEFIDESEGIAIA